MPDNLIQVIAEYLVQNEEEMAKFRAEIEGVAEDTELVNVAAERHTNTTEKEKSAVDEFQKGVGKLQQWMGYLETGLDATTGKTVAYADEVRQLSLVSGQSTEDSSRMLQVLSDFGLGLEDVEASAKKMNENGVTPTIENLAELSDQYLALEPGQERNNFLQEQLGRSGLKYAEVLSKGRDTLLKMNAGVAEGLILSQKQVDAAKAMQIAQDGVNDAWDATAVTLGNKLIPIQTDVINGINVTVRAFDLMKEKNISFAEATDIAGREIWEEQQAMLAHNDAAAEFSNMEAEAAEKAEKLSDAFKSQMSTMQSIASETNDFNAKQEEIKNKQTEIKGKINDLIAGGWSPLSDKVKDLQKDYDNLSVEYDENAQAHNVAMGKILYDLTITKMAVGGWTESEMGMAEQAALAFGQVDQEHIDMAKNFELVSDAVADGKLKIEDMGKALELLPELKNIEIVIKAITQITGALAGSNPQAEAGGYGYQGAGYAAGGISAGPASGHWELLHGTEAVIPLQNGAVPVAMSGQESGAGRGNVVVNLYIQSPITVLDQQQGQEALLSYIEYGVKALQDRGVLSS